jgi:hypothetical protein
LPIKNFMNKKTTLYCFLILIIGISTFSCKVQEKENVKIKLKPRPTKYLITELLDNEVKFDAISAKASVVFSDSIGNKTSFKTHLRIQKDSAIWISITPLLGIEMARVLITQDTVKLMNRAKSEYFIGDFDYINQLLGADLDYQMLEALLIGNSLDFEINDKIHSSIDRDKDLYFLSTEKKRKIRKEWKKDKDKFKTQIQALWLNPLTFKINELLLSSPHNDKSLAGVYSNFQPLETQLIPYNLVFSLQSNSANSIEINYSKFSMGKELTFPFNIPDKYVQIKQ